jgi:hypothetical protein
MRSVSKVLFPVIAAAFFVSAAMATASACEGKAGMTVWIPSSQSVADSSTQLPTTGKPGTDG